MKSNLFRSIGYWVSTAVIAFIIGGGGVADVMRIPPVVQGMKELGYPEYVCVIIGVWKVLGAIVILAPGLRLLKEWAYAGIVIDLTGASASHFAVGDEPIKIIMPLVFTVITMVSWRLRSSDRRITSSDAKPATTDAA